MNHRRTDMGNPHMTKSTGVVPDRPGTGKRRTGEAPLTAETIRMSERVFGQVDPKPVYALRFGDLYRGETRICGPSDLLAIAFNPDAEDPTIYAYGSHAAVGAKVTRTPFPALEIAAFPVTPETISLLGLIATHSPDADLVLDALRYLGEVRGLSMPKHVGL